MGKVLISTELSPLALTDIPARLMGDILCELSAEGKFSTCPELPHTVSAVPRGVEVTRATTNSAPLEGESGSVGGTGRCVPALGWPQASWYITLTAGEQ